MHCFAILILSICIFDSGGTVSCSPILSDLFTRFLCWFVKFEPRHSHLLITFQNAKAEKYLSAHLIHKLNFTWTLLKLIKWHYLLVKHRLTSCFCCCPKAERSEMKGWHIWSLMTFKVSNFNIWSLFLVQTCGVPTIKNVMRNLTLNPGDRAK